MQKSLLSIKDSLKGPPPAQKTPEADTPAPEEELASESREATPAKEEVDNARVIDAWKAYTASVEKDKPRVFSTLNNNLPVEEDGVFKLTLNSEAQIENFRKNIRPELISHIRRETGIVSLDIEVRLAESETRTKKVYTDTDKLEFLVKKNPDLADLSSRFGLDFDR